MSAHELDVDSPNFSLAVYERAIESRHDIASAVKELDKAIGKPAEIASIYNGNGVDVNRTALFVTLQPYTPNGATDTKRLLEHPVMREVIDLKWKNFGLRMYKEQLIMYCLLLMAMTLSVSMDLQRNESTHVYPTQFAVWLYVGVPLVLALGASPWFNYTYRFEWTLATLLCIAGALTSIYLSDLAASTSVHWVALVRFNNVVLGLTGLYFLRFELNEMFGEVAEHNRVFDCGFHTLSLRWQKVLYYTVFCPFSVVYQFAVMLAGRDEAKYFDSFFNRIQLPTFTALLIYVVHEFVWPCHPTVRLYVGIGLTMLVWILGLQYLEVHGTAGYLIPMMRGLLRDVYRFLAFYWPFQCAYACAYFLLFQHTDETTYNTIGHSFVTTFLVLLGQIELDPFENLDDTPSYVLGYTLLLTHATIVMVMLLNVLIAIMTKTVDGGLEQAKLEALVSFAECVLRSEKTAGLQPIAAEGAEKTALLKSNFSSKMDDFRIGDDDDAASVIERLESMEATLNQVVAMLKEMKKSNKTN